MGFGARYAAETSVEIHALENECDGLFDIYSV